MATKYAITKKGVLHMKDLKASDVMVRPVVSAKPHASARDVTLQVLSGLYRREIATSVTF